MLKNLFSSQKGFSLLELIVAMVLVGIVAGFVGKMFVVSVDTYNSVSSRKEVLQTARLAFLRMNREIRQIKDNSSISAAYSDSLEFTDIYDATISYVLSSGQIKRNNDALADNVQSLQFQYEKADGTILSTPVGNTSDIWKISFSISVNVNDHDVSLSSGIYLRNL